jgi:hypothetical protein
MRIAVPHHTTRPNARRIVEQKLDQLLASYGAHADQAEHSWTGDTLHFKGKARGFTVSGTIDVTDSDVILDSKLPLLAKAFEGRIRQTVETEAEKMFRMA